MTNSIASHFSAWPMAALALGVLLTISGRAHGQASANEAPVLLSVSKIWDQGRHNAFTDLIRFNGTWYCAFREGDGHVGGDGQARILASGDGASWESVALLGQAGVDLRDPKLSITADGRLMAVMGGSYYDGKELLNRKPHVAFSADGREWSAPQKVESLPDGDWLWRVTWHEGRAYGVTYNIFVDEGADWVLRLVTSPDGLDWEPVATLDVPGRPNETTVRFLADGRMLLLVRREGGNTRGWIGVSDAPYTGWTWHETAYRLGGPNFIPLPDGSLWAGSRNVAGPATCVLARFGVDTYEPALTLPSGGDCSYPGLVWHDGKLCMSYYSSHEGKTSIYLATIRLPE
ncbi:MAG: exo-alpha-sialidase [Candidatus Hydrogenedentes bacterium]|nr:exo-alpha-sialidase [Candidatus Hydrogenedentota bacterium]